MKQFIYADNAATTKLSSTALDAMLPWLQSDFSNPSQPYSFSRAAKAAIKESRQIIADCIGASPDEIFFTSGGTESDNWAIKESAISRTIITSEIEHHAVLNSCKAMAARGADVKYLRPTRDGVIVPDDLEKIISDMSLVSVMLANNEIGTIQPISELCGIAHIHGAIFHTDAVQAVGHIPTNVKDLGVDMLSASAHKFNGPKGVGFLYIKNGTMILPLHDGGSQEHGKRAGTENVAGIVGMATALKENCERISETAKRLRGYEKLLIDNLFGLDYIQNGIDNHLPGVINLSFKGASGEAILHRMDLKGICISTGSACDSVNTQVSHVIRAIGVPKEYAQGTIRISLGADNTEQDVIKIANDLKQILWNSGIRSN